MWNVEGVSKSRVESDLAVLYVFSIWKWRCTAERFIYLDLKHALLKYRLLSMLTAKSNAIRKLTMNAKSEEHSRRKWNGNITVALLNSARS